MEYISEEKKCNILTDMNNICYLRLRPDKTEDAFRCYNCNKIVLHKLNPVEYINNNNNNIINNHVLGYDDDRPLFY
jgi:hypothetical protein